MKKISFSKTIIPFGKIVNNMTETKRREEDLPSKNLDRSIECMLERKSEEPASHCSVM
jgi:hypothetical protein